MDVYVENIVARVNTGHQQTMLKIWKVLCGISLFIFCAAPMFGQLILGLLNLVMFVVSLLVVNYLKRSLSTVYEYTYANGEMTFTRMTTNRRKKLFTCHMEKVVQVCHYKEFRRSEHDKYKVRDFGSGVPGDGLYVMVVNSENGKQLVYFEPDAEFLDAMWRTSPRIVSKKR